MAGIRYRAPSPEPSLYITREGFEKLREEHQRLWRVLRPEVVQALSAAAAEGDRSENAEYQYRKKQLAEIDRRVRYLNRRLDRLKVVEEAPRDPSRIYFGAWVTLAGAAGETRRWRVVGPDELDPGQGLISIDSPLARAMLGKSVDDLIEVASPGGMVQWEVMAVDYGSE
ncbi:MAG: transcription elongation factor GreB [Xanthomonadales bacterium]|nr:transcription elongation factor GreB [Xanthomonadales bacterium]